MIEWIHTLGRATIPVISNHCMKSLLPSCLKWGIVVMKFKKLLRKRQCTQGEVSKIIACVKKYGLLPVRIGIGGEYHSLKNAENELGDGLDLTRRLIVEQTLTKLKLTTKYYEGKPCTYIFPLDGEDIEEYSGQRLFMEMCKYYSIPKIIDKPFYRENLNEKGGFSLSASPIIGYNKKGNKKEYYEVYEYDLNSAYSSIVLDGIPDLEHPSKIELGNVKVNKGEIGFLFDEVMSLVEPGQKADIKFKMIPCPEGLRNFVEKYYNLKKTTTGKERAKAKLTMNAAIGYCQRYNPFLRAYIIHRCNEKIERLIDENTLLWNTDAIFSTKRRNDLEIGQEIGQFKEIKINRFRYKGCDYQVDDEIPTYRSIPKLYFRKWVEEHGRCYNILTDETPVRHNLFKFDMKTLKLEVYR